MITRTKDYWVPLLRLMADLPGGQGKAGKVVALFLDRYRDQIDPSHFELKPDGRTEKWNNNVQWARQELFWAGYMDSPNYGVWRITPKAREWLTAYPNATELEDATMRPSSGKGRQSSPHPAPHPAPPAPDAAAVGVSLAKLENVRKFMPSEEFRRDFGEMYDRLLAEQRVQSITRVDRTRLVTTVMEQIYQIQEFVRGQSKFHPSSEELCDWIYQCYLYELHREVGVLWPLVDKANVEPWYYERTKRIAGACKAKV